MMSGYVLAEAIDHANGDIELGIAAWQHRLRRFIKWVQRVAYWYGELAPLSPRLRVAAFRAIGCSESLQAATLFVAARHDATAAEKWRQPEQLQIPIPIFH